MTSAADDPLPTVRVGHVLVPLDGSEFALQALPTARQLAARLGAELHTISVAEDERHAEQLRAVASAMLGADPGDPRVLAVTGDDPGEAIARRAGELDDCLVCLTTHGRGRLGGAVTGSVARSVMQRSSDAIVALGPVADNPGWSPRPRTWPEPLSVPRILACVDGSDASEQVLPVAAAWARALSMSLSIVTVVDDIPSSLRPAQRDVRYGTSGDAADYVAELAQRWRDSVGSVDGLVLRDPIGPANAIRLHLEQQPAGLVAVTTSARSGLDRVRLGAAAASIVRSSVAPCLVTPVRS
jgi:nucleotide-binding universal stress UspA family protein